jgi:hypothetical protein
LTRNILEHPHLAFDLPYLFQRARIDIQKEDDILGFTGKDDLLILKFAMFTSQYLCEAAQLPKDFCNTTRKLFEDKQSAIIHD